tara:strand:- start:653 stop:889 length:237 start_codon:yes stop_codon:yes gene_type:complete
MNMVRIEFRGAMLQVPDDVKLGDTVRSVYSNSFGEHPQRLVDTQEVLNEMKAEISRQAQRKHNYEVSCLAEKRAKQII